MNFVKFIFDPAILIILAAFISSIVFVVKKFSYVNTNLAWLINFLSKFKKSDLSYRFGEFDKVISQNAYISSVWHEFRNTLVFSESVAIKKQDNSVAFQNVSQAVNSIQTTVDPLYFFNEDSLVTSKYNNKFVQIAPTILTGLGPLFTFLNIAIAFTHVDFSNQDTTIASVANLMGSMQIAALCSVLAVSASLIFMFFEKLYYNKMCRVPMQKVQELLYGLFDNISSEKFLIELLKETKIQNSNLTILLNKLPEQFKVALDSSVSKSLIPYMENLLFGINNLNDSIKKINLPVKMSGGSDGDVVDKLF